MVGVSQNWGFHTTRELDSENSYATLGFAKCLLKLSKYAQVIQLSDTSPYLASLSEYWYFRSIAYYSYERGKRAIKYEMNYLKSSHSKESPTYNILSIDGGGVCGILPALWLSEIEYRTHRPISHLFNMIAGTSAGGIIAAGLSAPSWKMEYNKDMGHLFAKSDSWTLFKPRYSNKDRSSLFFDHFENVRLSTALTELVIPAVDESNLTHTHLFTRRNDSKDDTFYDTLMATTAAPTFFPPYEIKGRGFFLDGALHLNNPAMAAYEKAIQYDAAKEKIFVLSLGTGSYLPDPLNPDLYRGNLFWAQNLHKVVLPQQEGNTDRSMYNLLGKCYQRWQVWFEEPISLDDCERVPHLLELGNQYIEELDASDENPINKLVERLQRLN
ncbi:unnamed protein product [Rhizophagus irregularis]|uniref:PNPLA domain-containing protein n=1 Tax=Rhizophagus irregularis TaxID=588596 RepID=A0A915YX74_9GLOM|nr:unnamed protein product [Rhizophagus irregularis]